jgi:hypothetical protein
MSDNLSQQEVWGHYGNLLPKFFSNLGDAARSLAATHADRGLKYLDGGQAAFLQTIMTREGEAGAFLWLCEIGFGSWGPAHQAINWDAPEGEWPSLEIPIRLSWTGPNRWGQKETLSLGMGPIRIDRTRAEWFGKYEELSAPDSGSWIIRSLVEHWLLMDTAPVRSDATRGRVEQTQPEGVEAMTTGRWQPVRQLSSWGPNEVWVVRDSSGADHEYRVMKSVKTRKGPGTAAYKRLMREIEVTKELSAVHKGIVEVIEYAIPKEGEEWRPYYVMPLAAASLAKAKDYRGNLEGVLNLGIVVAAALEAAHERNVIHRDVKPDNILLMGDERRPVVADFGICFLANEEAGRLTASEAGTVGPADFVAPELLGGRADSDDIDGRVDVYSLGKTLYAVYNGGEVFPREYFAEPKHDLRLKGDDPRLTHLHGLLERMVVEDPVGRFANMMECRQALERALRNIKTGVRYESGMYGRASSAMEVLEDFGRRLNQTSGVVRGDLIREAIGRTERMVHEMTAVLADTHRIAAAEEAMIAVAFRCSEVLLSIGLSLISADNKEGFERWIESVMKPFSGRAELGMNRPHSIMRAASILALHTAGVAAYHRERLGLLRHLLNQYLEHPHWFIHIAMFQDMASRSWEWIVGCVQGSEVLQGWGIDRESVLDEVHAVAGLTVLAFLLRLDPTELVRRIPPAGELDIPALPGFIPGGCEWLESLPARFMESPSLEKTVARAMFDLAATELRARCGSLSKALATAVLWSANATRKSPVWISGIPRGGSWEKWTGAQ